MNILDRLLNTVLFKEKSKDEVSELIAKIDYCIKEFEKDDSIFTVGEPTINIGIILKGSIRIEKILANGKVINLLYKECGDIFGEGSVFSKAKTYPCNIYASDMSEIMMVNKESILELLSNDPIILNNFLKSFANRALLLNQRTELLSYSSIQHKIAFSLIYLMDEYKKKNIISLPFSKKIWSEQLNVSRPSLFRELKTLCSRGIIGINNRDIEIINEKSLLKVLTS